MSTCDSGPRLFVVTHRAWLAHDFAAAADTTRVVHTLGLDVPAHRPRDAWWAPTEWAARALRSGAKMRLTAPGPAWLAEVPQHLTRREIWAGPLTAVADAPTRGWCKPAEVKAAAVPARWARTTTFAEQCRRAGMPSDTWIQVSPRRLDLAAEYRTFVRDRIPVAVTPYLLDGHTWHPGMTCERTADALAFAAAATAALGESQPRDYVLDVAVTTAGEWLVVEGNPAWSAAPYGADLTGVLQVVLAANRPEPRWRWTPDPWLVRRASQQRLLGVDA